VKVTLEWVWENDPQGLPDDDHARCIAARGERFVAYGGQLFALTTRPCTRLSASRGGHSTARFSTLQMEYLGLDWARGLVQQSWGCDPFESRPLGGEAQQAAGLALLATVAGALAAGSSVRGGASGALDEFDDRRRPQRPPGWPPHGRAPRPRRPALLPLTVGRHGDLG
jgi:hypothetical protein